MEMSNQSRASTMADPIAQTSLMAFRTGRDRMEASTRGITMCCVGSTAIRRSASSCPLICMEPISTVKAVPILAANIMAPKSVVAAESRR